MQLFTREKRETLAFHIMTKEIYPHSVLISQYNPSKQVCMKSSLLVQTLATFYLRPSHATVARLAIAAGAKVLSMSSQLS